MHSWKSLFVFILSGITAFLALNIILMFYYCLPIHIKNPDSTTDYMWESKHVWVEMTEGISWGKMDENGFNNYRVIQNPDILILGSSHMEATYVFQKWNTVNVLKEYLEQKNLSLSVYNKGISGHHFLKCCKYLNANTQDRELKYVVIETMKVDYSVDEIQKLFSDAIDYTESYDSGLIFYLQKMPFLRLLFYQCDMGLLNLFFDNKNNAHLNPLRLLMRSLSKRNEQQSLMNTHQKVKADVSLEECYDLLFSYIENNSHGKKIIIFYHPEERPEKDGSLEYRTDENCLSQFSRSAEEHGITFIDLTAASKELWQTEHKTTHGFCTGTAFSGHLNKNGHRIAARHLADCIIRLEKQNVSF